MTGRGAAELRAWLDRLLNVVDGLADDVRHLGRDGGNQLSADTASRELVDLQRALYELLLTTEEFP